MQPVPYTITTDFSNEEASGVAGRSTVRTAAVDVEYANLATTISQIRTNMAALQRDDLKLMDLSVQLHTLSAGVLALLGSAGFTIHNPIGWLTATAYPARDMVTQGTGTYVSVSAHTSGVFATDLAAGKWALIFDSTTYIAAGVTFTPTGTIAATNVQAAIAEVASESLQLANVTAFVQTLIDDATSNAFLTTLTATRSEAGAVAVTMLNKVREVVSVKDFGATGNFATDDTVTIQAANDAVELFKGGLFFPTGDYLYTVLTVDTGYVNWYGEGQFSAVLRCNSANGGVTFTGASLALCGVHNLGFAQNVNSTNAAASLLKTSGVLWFTVENCYFNGFVGASNLAHNLLWLNGTGITVMNSSGVGGKTSCVTISGSASANDVTMHGGTWNSTDTIGRPLFITGVQVGTVQIFGTNFHQGAACRITNSAYVEFHGVYFDSAQGPVEVDTVTHIYWYGGQTAAVATGAKGIALTAVTDFGMFGHRIVNCDKDGLTINATCKRGTFDGLIVDGVNRSNTAATPCVNIAAGATNLHFKGGRCGNFTAGYGGFSDWGFALQAGASDYITIDGVDCTSNDTAGIVNNSTGMNNRIINNPGYNPTAAVSAVAGASPYTYTAGPAPETVVIHSGTVSNIVIGGVGVYASTDRTVHLAPNKTVVITHTVAPTVTRVPE